MTAQVGLGGGGSDGMRMPGLNVTNPVLHGRVSFGEGHLVVAGYTNPVGAIESVATKNVIASIVVCSIGGIVSGVYSAAEYEPNGEQRWQYPHRGGAVWQWERRVNTKEMHVGDGLI